MSTANWLASFGVGILLIAFFLNISGKIRSRSKLYLSLNIAGGSLSAFASWMADFYPFLVLNLIWTFTAIITLLKGDVSRETK